MKHNAEVISKGIELGCILSIVEMYSGEFSDEMEQSVFQLIQKISEECGGVETSGKEILQFLFKKYSI